MVSTVCDWLNGNADTSGGLPFALPSVNAYPHAPEWRTDADLRSWINPIGSIIAMLTKWGVDHPWVARGTAFCWHFLATEEPTGFGNLRCVLAFLVQAQDRERAALWLEEARSYLLSSTKIEFDLETPGHVRPPLDWASTLVALATDSSSAKTSWSVWPLGPRRNARMVGGPSSGRPSARALNSSGVAARRLTCFSRCEPMRPSAMMQSDVRHLLLSCCERGSTVWWVLLRQ